MTAVRACILVATGLLLGGCALRGGPTGPVVSPTGIVYPPGVPPRETRFSQTATLYLGQEEWERALEQAQQGLLADSSNPVHHFIAGSAHAGVGNLEEADRLWREAQRLYPAYELEIEPAREGAWARAFNDGVELYLSGSVEEAIARWEGAARIYDLRADVHRNLGVILAEIGEYRDAAETYRRGLAGLEGLPATRFLDEDELRERDAARVTMTTNLAQILLFLGDFPEAESLLRERLAADSGDVELRVALGSALSGQGLEEEANEVYGALLRSPGMSSYQLTQIGSSLFRGADYEGAAMAFRKVTELEPDGRDGWFNYANALLAMGDWDTLLTAGQRLVEVDPLTEGASLIDARAHVEVGDEPSAREALGRIETLPVLLEDLQLWRSDSETRVRGTALGNRADPGTSVRMRFVFFAGPERLGEETLELAAPAAGVSADFSVSFSQPATAYRYELID